VVGIQTTRLILFEFFIRFLSAHAGNSSPDAAVRILPGASHETPSRWLFAILFCTAVTAVLATLALVAAGPALAAEAPGGGGPSVLRWGFIAAAASAASPRSAPVTVAQVGTAALGALAEKPDLFGRVLVMVGLAEASRSTA